MSASIAHISPSTPMGATLVADGATFRVWAPNATSVYVRGSFNEFSIDDRALLVEGNAGYWHGFIAGVREGDTYKYWIEGPAGPGWKRDPYARELREPDGNCVVRSTAFPWHDTGYKTPAFNDFVIYQLHVGAFSTPRLPRGGTFLDVVDKIPYLSALGVTAIQLLPIQEFAGTFSLGYNGTDYFSPEATYAIEVVDLPPYLARVNGLLQAKLLVPYAMNDLLGEMNQLKSLVDLCHVYGLAVIFDVVCNHAGGGFGDESLWFFDRQFGMDKPLWWNSLYFSDKTWAGGVVFNFQSDPVRQFLINNAIFLFDEYRIDGLRFDEVSVVDKYSYGRGWDFCQALSGTLRAHRPGAHSVPMTAIANQLGLGYLRDRWRGVNSVENQDLVMQPKDDTDHNRMPRIPKVADPSNSRSWYATSRSRAATGILLTSPGIPMLFMGEEFLEDKQWSDDISGHPDLLLYWAGPDAHEPAMRDFLRFTRELIHLRWQHPALRSEGFSVIHVHDDNRVLAFQRWIPGAGRDLVIVASLADDTRYGYEIGFPSGGRWHELFNSDVYEHWMNPNTQGNGGGVEAKGPALHGLSTSATLTIPANSILVFGKD